MAKKTKYVQLLNKASERAIMMLIDAMENPELTANARLDAAKEIINRVYGKSGSLAEEKENIKITMESAVKEYAE